MVGLEHHVELARCRRTDIKDGSRAGWNQGEAIADGLGSKGIIGYTLECYHLADGGFGKLYRRAG